MFINENAFVTGTSSTIAIDGKINKVCHAYRCLTSNDVKLQAFDYIASNLGNFYKFYLLFILFVFK